MTLPNFFCGGAPKSGTTTLYDILKNHPDIFLSSYKEPFFFNNDEYFKNGKEWYSQTFFSDYDGQKIIGDFTPTYLASEEVPERILNMLGRDVKFLFILRDPVDRAYSQFLHNKRDQKENLDFKSALKVETERSIGYNKNLDKVAFLKHGYAQLSHYSASIKRYQDVFGKENVLPLIFEEVFADVESHIKIILRFLGIDENVSLKVDMKSNPSKVARSRILKKVLTKDNPLKRFSKKLVSSVLIRKKIRKFIQTLNNKPQEYDKLSADVKAGLFSQYFEEDVNSLEHLLNRDLKIWKQQ